MMRKYSIPKGKKGSWIAYADTALRKYKLTENAPEWAMSSIGWSGSYHDATYNPVIAVYGSSPSRAKKRLKQLLNSEFLTKEKRRYGSKKICRQKTGERR